MQMKGTNHPVLLAPDRQKLPVILLPTQHPRKHVPPPHLLLLVLLLLLLWSSRGRGDPVRLQLSEFGGREVEFVLCEREAREVVGRVVEVGLPRRRAIWKPQTKDTHEGSEQEHICKGKKGNALWGFVG